MLNKKLFFVFLFCIFSRAYCQSACPVIPEGHSFWITSMDISPNGKYIASASMDNSVVIWDVNSGAEIKSIRYQGSITDVEFIDDENIISYSQQKRITVTNVLTDSSVELVNNNQNVFARFDFRQNRLIPSYILKLTPDKNYALVTDNLPEIKILNVKTGVIERRINRHSDFINCIAINFDGTLYLSGAEDKSVQIWDSQKHEVCFNKKFDAPVLSSAFFNNSASFAIGLENGKIRIIDPFSNKSDSLEDSWSQSGAWTLKISSDNKLLFAGYEDGKIKVWDLISHKMKCSYQENGISPITEIKLISDELFAASSYDKTIKIFDVGYPHSLKTFGGYVKKISAFSYNSKNKILINSDMYGRIYSWDLANARLNGTVKAEPNGNIVSVDVSDDSEQFITASWLKNIKLWTVDSLNMINRKHFDDTTGFVRFIPNSEKFAAGLNTSRERDNILIGNNKDFSIEKSLNTGKRITCLNVSPDGTLIAAGHEDGSFAIIRLDDFSVTSYERPKDRAGDIRFIGGSDELGVAYSGRFLLFNTVDKSEKNLDVYGVNSFDISPKNKYMLLAGGNSFLKNGFYILCYDPRNNEILFSAFSENGPNYARFITDTIFVICKESVVELYNLPEKKKVCTLLAVGDDSWMAYTPDNYYYCSKDLARILNFRGENFKLFPFSQFDIKYNRPDIILKRIGLADGNTIAFYSALYNKRLATMGFTEKDLKSGFNLPEIKILNKDKIKFSSKDRKLKLNIAAWDSLSYLNRINVLVNNVPAFGSNGISLKADKTRKIEKKIIVDLSAGMNKVELSVLNENGAESMRETVSTNYIPGTTKKNTLYVISLGISEFADKNKNLKYAVKDARDLVNVYKGQKNLWGKVIVDTLFGPNLTPENIGKLKNKLMKSNIDDGVIVFFAGHGLFDTKKNYYLANYNTDFNNPLSQNSLSYDALEGILDGIPARNKVLFIDACYSGEADDEKDKSFADAGVEKGKVEFGRSYKAAGTGMASRKSGGRSVNIEMMKEIFASFKNKTGGVVISSASGNQYAYEKSQWGNGAFTHCLLEGLEMKKSDLNHDGKIMISEMQKYLHDEVPRITDKLQNPTSRVENIGTDFRIW